MRPVIKTKALTAASGNAICLSQTPAGAGSLLINGASAASGVATLDSQRQVQITSAGNDSGRTFVVTGQDEFGRTFSETVFPGPNIGSVATKSSFLKVTSITVDAATAGAITVGTNTVGSTPAIPLDQYLDPFAVSLFTEFPSGAATVIVEYTADDIWSSSFIDGLATWTTHSSWTGGKSAHTDSNIAFPASAVRMTIQSGTGQARFEVRQAGGHGVS